MARDNEGFAAKPRQSRPIRDLAERLRKLVRDAAPDATEVGYSGWRLIGYRSPRYFCFIAPQADHVRLGFEPGVRLADPDGILEPMGQQVRFVRTILGRALPTAAIDRLIQRALRTLPAARDAPRRRRSVRRSWPVCEDLLLPLVHPDGTLA